MNVLHVQALVRDSSWDETWDVVQSLVETRVDELVWRRVRDNRSVQLEDYLKIQGDRDE